MIRLTDRLPELTTPSAELLKLHCTRDCYPDLAMFWEQDDGQAYVGMLDLNMVILNRGGDPEELSHFIAALSPCCVFSDLATLHAVGLLPKEDISVMCRRADVAGETPSDPVLSRELYELLNVDGLSLPEYPYFAVDICRRLNHGMANVFALKGRCAAISLHHGGYAIMNGIASHEKGGGTQALRAILQKNFDRTFLACCRQSVRGFYEKNGFHELYKTGYWVRNE